MSNMVVMAVASHPDDIEYAMAGTMLMLQKAGCEVHYMNVANGSLGTEKYDYDTIVKMRREEAVNAAKLASFHFHDAICDDLEVFYNIELLGKLIPVVREVKPSILLTHGPYDYMEDHVNAGRLGVGAAFCRGMQNFKCAYPAKKYEGDITVYHCMPHSISDWLRRPVIPGIFVDIETTIEMKKDMLACHKSQQSWLDVSQGINAYTQDLIDRGVYYGKLSGKYKFAEGWIRHNHQGFCPQDADPLTRILAPNAFVNEEFEESIKVHMP